MFKLEWFPIHSYISDQLFRTSGVKSLQSENELGFMFHFSQVVNLVVRRQLRRASRFEVKLALFDSRSAEFAIIPLFCLPLLH